jgi:hypothetical protein
MDKETWIREWVKIIWRDLELGDYNSEDMGTQTKINKLTTILGDIFDVGVQTGRDIEKITVQLSKLGQPNPPIHD